MIAFCWPGLNHFMTLLPGNVDLKTNNTTIVLPRMHEMQRTKVMPNAVCRSMHDHSEGRPMKVREQRKHIIREKSSRKLRSELLARTMGVFLWQKNMQTTTQVQKEPKRDITSRAIPMVSVKDRNSTCLGMQVVLSSLDQNSGRQRTHSIAS